MSTTPPSITAVHQPPESSFELDELLVWMSAAYRAAVAKPAGAMAVTDRIAR